MSLNAAIYVRQSEDKTGEGAAVARQLAECQDLARRHAWTVAEVYSDNDRSATSGKPRPDWTRLLSDLAAGRHDVLVCWHTDRLYRRLRDLVELVEIAEARSLRIASVRAADIDLSTPAGRMLAGMLGSAARYEMEQKALRQRAANTQRARDGVVLWSRRPYGFDRDGHDIRVVPAEAKVIRVAAQRALQGDSLLSIAGDLNRRGIVTSTGGPWNVNGLRRTLLSPRLTGRVVHNGEEYGRTQARIIDDDTADRLTALLTDPRRRFAPSTTVKYLLSGIAICGRCGATMLATTNGRTRTPVYRCIHCFLARQRDLTDHVVVSVLLARLARPDAAALLVPDSDVDSLRAKITELRDRRDALAVMLADGILGASAVKGQASKLTEQINDVERSLNAAMGTSPVVSLVGVDDVAAVWDALDLKARRAIVRSLMAVRILPAGKGIRFTPKQIEITWRTT